MKQVFGDGLEAHHPLRAAHVLSLVRQTAGGRLYDSESGTRMEGRGPYAAILKRRFETACRRFGLGWRIAPGPNRGAPGRPALAFGFDKTNGGQAPRGRIDQGPRGG